MILEECALFYAQVVSDALVLNLVDGNVQRSTRTGSLFVCVIDEKPKSKNIKYKPLAFNVGYRSYQPIYWGLRAAKKGGYQEEALTENRMMTELEMVCNGITRV